jgi:hypothetical protein
MSGTENCANQKNSTFVGTIYTIVYTSADADRCQFPPAEGKASFNDLQAARAELWRLVEAEKKDMKLPFAASEYRESYDEDYWEAYRVDYAAGWFRRFAVISSPLMLVQNPKKVDADGN